MSYDYARSKTTRKLYGLISWKALMTAIHSFTILVLIFAQTIAFIPNKSINPVYNITFRQTFVFPYNNCFLKFLSI